MAFKERQYYGHFFYKDCIEHVIVETVGDTITEIRVRSGNLLTRFTLEQHEPDVHGDELHGRYDPTNKLHVNALIHVYTALNPDDSHDDEIIDYSPYHARPNQDWPADERIVTGGFV